MIDWQYFKLRPEIKNLPLLEQRRAFLQHQLQYDRFLTEATSMQQQMQAQSAASAGGGKNSSSPTPSIPCLLYTSPSPRDRQKSRMPSSA